MFKILQKTLNTGMATVAYPHKPARVPEEFRGAPHFDLARWKDARPAAEVCPTGAIQVLDRNGTRHVEIDYGRCIFCGVCADVSSDGAVRIRPRFEMASRDRRDLVIEADYSLSEDGTQ